jgi:membrane fusion protein, copper/silver efflux system
VTLVAKQVLGAFLALALLAGSALYIASRGPHAATPADPPPASSAPTADAPIYTCSMHPQVRMREPGRCPICGMALVKADGGAEEPTRAELTLSEHALAMASVETTPVVRRALVQELRAVGKIRYNESSLGTVTARVDGYAERLYVDFTGVEIQAGDHLAEIYSPDLLVAQQELLIALEGGGTGGGKGTLVETAKLKLRRLGLTQGQIQALVDKRQLTERITLLSPIQGTVIEKMIVQNSAFRAGDTLYRVANLDTVWVYLDIYEYDLPRVRYGQRVRVRAESLPGRTFTGQVTFVQPVVSEETRTVQIPVQIQNREHDLKPGMFVSAVVESTIGTDAKAAPTGVEGKYTCPMHVQVLRDSPGVCPICGMSLVEIPGKASGPTDRALHPGEEGSTQEPSADVLAVPTGAVLDSGTHQLVYVERTPGLFQRREVVLGPRAGEFFPVLEGLAEGERVVTRGGFLIDSQFQISGQPSLFYPEGLAGAPIHHGEGATAPSGPPPQHRH